MGAVTIGLLVIGCVGAVILAVSLLFGELVHIATADIDGPFSVPVVAGALGALGFLGAIGAELAGGSGALALVTGGATGLAGAVPTGWLVARLTRSLAAMPTDGTLTASDLIGAHGIVVTRVPAGGYGEVRVMVGGQPLKLNAKCDAPLAAGVSVFVIDAPTESSVVVVETTPIA